MLRSQTVYGDPDAAATSGLVARATITYARERGAQALEAIA